MMYLKKILNSKFTLLVIVSALLISYCYMALRFISISATSDAPAHNNNVAFALFIIFVFPFGLSWFFGIEGDGAIWGRRLYNGMYIATVLITGFSGVCWYTYAQTNGYLEPVTYLLSLATAAIIYNRDKYFESIKQSEKPA